MRGSSSTEHHALPAISSLPREVKKAHRFGSVTAGSAIRELLWVLLGQSITAVATLAGVRLLTENLAPATFGEYMLALTGSILAQQVFFAPLAAAVQRFVWPVIEMDQWNTFWRDVRKIFLCSIGVVVISVGLLAIYFGCQGQKAWACLACATGTFTIAVGAAGLLDAVHAAVRRRADVACHQACTQWLRWSLASGAAWWTPTAYAATWGSALAVIAMVAVRLRTFRKLSQPWSAIVGTVGDDWYQRVTAYYWPFALWGVFTWVGLASDRWALATWGTASDVGHYAALYQIGYFPCVMLGDALQQFLGPILFGQVGVANDAQRQRQGLRWLLSAVVPISVVFAVVNVTAWLVAGTVTGWLVAASYRSHEAWFALLVMAGSLFSLGQVLALGVIGTVGSARLLPVKIGCSLLTAAANFFAARYAGISGVVVAMPLTAACYAVWCGCLCLRIDCQLQRQLRQSRAVQQRHEAAKLRQQAA